jgi:hypothetical protein
MSTHLGGSFDCDFTCIWNFLNFKNDFSHFYGGFDNLKYLLEMIFKIFTI